MTKPFYTIGLESSCDETAVAILNGERELVANVIYSQAEMHARYGGVVPEVASRNHLRKLPYLVRDALLKAAIDMHDISLVAATYGPGLVGPLLVGLSYGKGMAFGLNVPFIGVNHLEGHIFAQRLCDEEVAPPFMALIVSGGHTSLVDVVSYGKYHLAGMTVDDAAGEALDKVGKMLGIGYPAGAEVDRLASQGDPTAINFPRPMSGSPGFDFSFAGLKTAVLYHLRKHPRERKEDVAASFLASVVSVLTKKSIDATRRYHRKNLVVVGGVAANSHLRKRMHEDGRKRGIEVIFPAIEYCTDNAAMIASAGAYHHLVLHESHSLSLGPEPSLSL
ncbi:MAG: tRNA (adenosine(37)-N6)-threonylcarbamoyltransferase complex transferase subunit TsaD [Candidatus Bipolaricaulota bacterium]|nr:tRNA (adenosine(37)-N6)-threonylcarbamoyltransferase complex transferase subunit TsaD [Candidatus Bipolaricaulota bacterium]